MTTAAASAPDTITPAFEWTFTDPLTKHDHSLSGKEIQQVYSIHRLLMAPFTGGEDLQVQVRTLVEKLSNKNTSALKFVCADLECLPVLKLLHFVYNC